MATIEGDIIDLQTQLAFQESVIEQLNQVVTDQQKQIDRLELAIETLKVQMSTMQTSMHQGNGNGEQHEIPPHY